MKSKSKRRESEMRLIAIPRVSEFLNVAFENHSSLKGRDRVCQKPMWGGEGRGGGEGGGKASGNFTASEMVFSFLKPPK